MAQKSANTEITKVAGHTAICDGLGGALGHPRVFLALDRDTHEVICPYCSRKFVQAEHSHAA